MIAERLVEEGRERASGVGHGYAAAGGDAGLGAQLRPLLGAAGRRLGMCSVGQPSTGRVVLQHRAGDDALVHLVGTVADRCRIGCERYQPSTGRSPE